LRGLDPAEIGAEIDRQVAAFKDAFGRPPGLRRRAPARPPASGDSRGAAAAPGRRRARLRGIPHNRGFNGVYDLSGRQPYGPLMERFVTGIRKGGLVMCHPGFPDAELAAVAPATAPRLAEHAYLAGPDFAGLLARRRLAVARLRDCLG
jgi:hypothetical protein